jgi:hypothetical protein
MAARDAFRAAECPGPKLAAAAGRTPYAAKGGSRAVGVNFCQTSGVSQFCRKPCLRGSARQLGVNCEARERARARGEDEPGDVERFDGHGGCGDDGGGADGQRLV